MGNTEDLKKDLDKLLFFQNQMPVALVTISEFILRNPGGAPLEVMGAWKVIHDWFYGETDKNGGKSG